jgi:transposase
LSIKRVLGSLNLNSIRAFLTSLYHRKGAGRKPYNPVCLLKAQILKYLWRIPSDRRLSLTLKRNKRAAKACGFKKQKTPSHGLFTHFRHRLSKDGYEKVFSLLLEKLLKHGAVKGEVVALDGTAIKAYSQRSLDNKTGKSDQEARVGKARRGFVLGYKVHTACCTSCELPLAFMVAPCNMNEKLFAKPLLEKLKNYGFQFKAVLADAQYNSSKVREDVKGFGAEPVIPYRRSSKVKNGLKVGKDFITRGVRRLVKLFRKRVSVERMFGRAKEWLLLDHLRVRGLEQVFIHACLSFLAMLTVALTAIRQNKTSQIRCIKHYTTQ